MKKKGSKRKKAIPPPPPSRLSSSPPPLFVYAVLGLLLKLINYSRCCYPTRSHYSGQLEEFRSSMKNELKTTCVWKLFQNRV